MFLSMICQILTPLITALNLSVIQHMQSETSETVSVGAGSNLSAGSTPSTGTGSTPSAGAGSTLSAGAGSSARSTDNAFSPPSVACTALLLLGESTLLLRETRLPKLAASLQEHKFRPTGLFVWAQARNLKLLQEEQLFSIKFDELSVDEMDFWLSRFVFEVRKANGDISFMDRSDISFMDRNTDKLYTQHIDMYNGCHCSEYC